jgi:hypothetical protein
MPESPELLLHVTMTPEAALRFQAALYHATARIEDEEHAEWLRWGAGRVTYAQRLSRAD